MRISAAFPAVLLAAALVGCGANEPAAVETSTTTPAVAPTGAPRTPEYELSRDGRGITVLVKTDDTQLLGLVWREVSGRVLGTDPEGGYFVTIDCAFGHDPAKAANRLGNGKIAVGKLGAAQTGLQPGQRQIDWVPGRTCRADAPTKTFDPSRRLDRDYATELCRGRIEEKYVADQRPVTLSSVTATELGGRWTVAGVAQGKSSGSGETAKVPFECVVSPDPLRTEVTKFEP